LIPPGESGLTSISPSGSSSFTGRNATLQILISLAHGVDSNQVTGAPLWLESQQCGVSAKWEGNAALSYEQLRIRFKSCLPSASSLRFAGRRKRGRVMRWSRLNSAPQMRKMKGGSSHPMHIS